MAWKYISYEYPYTELFQKIFVWVDKTAKCYFTLQESDESAIMYYGGSASHALATGLKLTPYVSAMEAQTNYLTIGAGKTMAILPLNKMAKIVKIFIEEGSTVTVYEFRPSVYLLANEIVSGTLDITDQLSDAPLISVTVGAKTRVKIGEYEDDTYGIAVYTASGSKIFAVSEIESVFCGFDVDDSSLSTDGIVIDAANHAIRSVDYVSNLSGWKIDDNEAEFQNILARGRFRTVVFEYATMTAINGMFVVTQADVLSEDMNSLDAEHMHITGATTFAVNDILHIKDGVNEEYLRVTSGGPTRYTVARDLAGAYSANANPAWPRGTAVISERTTNQGFVVFDATTSAGPRVSMYRRTSTTYNAVTELVRIGNLYGFTTLGGIAYGAEVYGFAAGTADAFIAYDTTNGLRVKGTITIVDGDVPWSTVGGTGCPADNATVGATWGTNLASIPARFGAPGAVAGLYMTADYSGYWNGAAFKTYIDKLGNMILGDVAGGGSGLAWDQDDAVLVIRGKIVILADETSSVPWSTVGGTGCPADNATVGATWGSNLGSIPAYLGTPGAAGLYLTADYMGYYNTTWKTYFDKNGNMILGNYAGGGAGISWNQASASLAMRGSIAITASSSGYGQFSDKPTDLSDINSTEGSKLSGIAAGATVGATWGVNIGGSNLPADNATVGAIWGTNLTSIPARFGTTPTAVNADGLYITADYLGFWDQSAVAFAAYMDKQGNFQLGNPGTTKGVAWNQGAGTLAVQGTIYAIDGHMVSLTLGKSGAANGSLTLENKDDNTYIRIGTKNGFTTTGEGIFMGLDYADSNKPKIYIGDANSHMYWDDGVFAIKMASGEAFEVYGDIQVYGTGTVTLGTTESYTPKLVFAAGSSEDDNIEMFSVFTGGFFIHPHGETDAGSVRFGGGPAGSNGYFLDFMVYTQDGFVLYSEGSTLCRILCDTDIGSLWFDAETYTVFETPYIKPNATNTIDLGTTDYRWDEIFADEVLNVADFYHLDTYDDIAAIKAIQASGTVDSITGLPFIDDNTIPEWLLARHSKDRDAYRRGDIMRDHEGKPYLSLRTVTSLLMGAVRQLDAKFEERLAKLEASKN